MCLQAFLAMGGKFTLSDDSHGIDQVGLNYRKTLDCVKRAGIGNLYYLAHITDATPEHDARFRGVGFKAISIELVEAQLR
jgi:histidinol-phosphatase (PHP family)